MNSAELFGALIANRADPFSGSLALTGVHSEKQGVVDTHTEEDAVNMGQGS